MDQEKRTREGKLRDRLAKKRKAKEDEMQQAALSERVRAFTPQSRKNRNRIDQIPESIDTCCS